MGRAKAMMVQHSARSESVAGIAVRQSGRRVTSSLCWLDTSLRQPCPILRHARMISTVSAGMSSRNHRMSGYRKLMVKD